MKILYIILALFILFLVIWPKAVIGLILIFGVITVIILMLYRIINDDDYENLIL